MLDSRLFVTIEEMHGKFAPRPLPLENGFSKDTAYRVLGDFSVSADAEHLVVLANDEDQLWFISNRHLRAYCFDVENFHYAAMRLPLGTKQRFSEWKGNVRIGC